MADWRTYVKAARSTARKQAPAAKDAARRAGDRAGGYVRAAGRAVDGGWREDDARAADGATGRDHGRDRDEAPRSESRTRPSGERLRRDAAAYYTVASRHVERANIVPRVLRALRDALLIGLSLVVIWAVLAAAGIPIPFTTVLIVVGVIVVVSFGAGLYGQWKRSREALDATEDPRDR